MKEKLTELIKQAKYCTADELAEYLISAGLVLPVAPGREMGHDMAERCYRNGEEAMREKVINYLREQKGISMGVIRATLSDAIEKVRKL
jgi:hypothetical protein